MVEPCMLYYGSCVILVLLVHINDQGKTMVQGILITPYSLIYAKLY